MSLDYYLRCKCCGENVFSRNITHNVHTMANNVKVDDKALGDLLWDYEGKNTLEYRNKVARGLTYVLTHRKELELYESPNGWGTYEGFKEFVIDVSQALFDYPDCEVWVSK